MDTDVLPSLEVKDELILREIHALKRGENKLYFSFADGDRAVLEMDGIDGKSLLALDVEGAALRVKNIDSWCYEWAKYVYYKTGIVPLIYTSESYTHLFKKTADFGCGLWCAKWSKNPPKKIKPFPFVTRWYPCCSA